MCILNNDIEQFLKVLRSGFDQTEQPVDLDNSLLPKIENIALRQSILGIIIAGFKNQGYSSWITEKMKHHNVRATYFYVQRKNALDELVAIMDEEGIDYILLKGAELCSLYPQPYMRECSDIDVLIREEDLEKTIPLIESKTHFKFYKLAHHDANFINERVHLELHFSLQTNLEKCDNVLVNAWEYATPVGDGHRYQFSPEFNIFYITTHAAKHFVDGGSIGIRPLLDLWLLRSKMVYDEEKVEELMELAGLTKFYKTCCQLIDVWFAGTLHSDVTRELEKLVFSGGVFGSEHAKVLSQERRTQENKQSYTMSRIVRSKRDIQAMFPRSKKHPVLIPYYQVVRWTHLLKPAKRRAARKEIKLRRSLDQAEVDRYNQLLEKLGM